MSKEDVLSLFVYAGMLAIAFVVGFCVLYPSTGLSSVTVFNSNKGILVLFVIICLLVGVILNGLLVELGHLVGLKLGGYSIVTFNVFGFCWYKKNIDGKMKWKFKFPKTPDGLTGETIGMPKKEKANPLFAVLIPFIIFALEAVAMYMVMYFINTNKAAQASLDGIRMVKFAVIIIATIGLMFALYNYFPAHIDSTTDGYRLVLLTKKINIKAYNEYLRISGSEALGIDAGNYIVFDEITDYTAQLNLLSVYKAIDSKDYELANKLLDHILENKSKISKLTAASITAQKFYLRFLLNSLGSEKEPLEPIIEDWKKVDDLTKTYVYKANTLEGLKTYYCCALRIEKSTSEMKSTIEKYRKVYKKSSSLNKDKERALMNLIVGEEVIVQPTKK